MIAQGQGKIYPIFAEDVTLLLKQAWGRADTNQNKKKTLKVSKTFRVWLL
jgi:hypothetical protein